MTDDRVPKGPPSDALKQLLEVFGGFDAKLGAYKQIQAKGREALARVQQLQGSREKSVYRTRPTKRGQRRTAADMEAIREALYVTLKHDKPMTVRQVYYQLVSQGVIAKTEAEYKGTVCRLLAQMRRDHLIPFSWVADNTRWMRKPTTYDSLSEMLQITKDTYRRALWSNQDAYVEVWLEKDALSGVVIEETDPWDVPLMVTRGYPSLTFLHAAAEEISAQEKPTYLYYLGDWDPSGVDIPRKVEADIRRYAPSIRSAL